MLIRSFATALLAVYKPKLLLSIILFVLIVVFYQQYVQVPNHIQFAKTKNLEIIDGADPNSYSDYAEDSQYYYHLGPEMYFKISKQESEECEGFDKTNWTSWCGILKKTQCYNQNSDCRQNNVIEFDQ